MHICWITPCIYCSNNNVCINHVFYQKISKCWKHKSELSVRPYWHMKVILAFFHGKLKQYIKPNQKSSSFMKLRLGLTLELHFQCISNPPVKSFTSENQVVHTQNREPENQGQILGIKELASVIEEIT